MLNATGLSTAVAGWNTAPVPMTWPSCFPVRFYLFSQLGHSSPWFQRSKVPQRSPRPEKLKIVGIDISFPSSLAYWNMDPSGQGREAKGVGWRVERSVRIASWPSKDACAASSGQHYIRALVSHALPNSLQFWSGKGDGETQMHCCTLLLGNKHPSYTANKECMDRGNRRPR